MTDLIATSREIESEAPAVDEAAASTPEPEQAPAGDDGRLLRFAYIVLLVLTIYALGIYWYGTSRYRGFWGENDTHHLTHTLHFALLDNSIITQRAPYGNGLTYQALSVFLVRTSGVSMQDLQLFVFPTIAAMLPLVAFNFYRVVTGSVITALFATLLLFNQPDFLFVTWRGSHEKFTWFMALLILWVIVRIFSASMFRRRQAILSGAFVYLAFTFITINAFFASSFTAAIAISAASGLGWLALRRYVLRRPNRDLLLRVGLLSAVTAVCAFFLYLFFFHIYPPALGLLNALDRLVDGLSRLFLFSDADTPEAVSAYDFLSVAYVDPRMFLILAGFSFALMGFSGLVWLRETRRYIFKPEITEADRPRVFLWLVYAGFALQLVASVFVDRVDTVGANIQVRLFTPMLLVAIPMASIGLHDILTQFRPNWRLALVWAMLPVLMIASVLSLFKMTNEPMVSNNWVYTTAPERRAAEWLLDHAESPTIWEGRVLRQRFYLPFLDPEIPTIYFRSGPVPENVLYYLISDLERASWSRASQPLPHLSGEQRVYDNGLVQVYYRRPFTPFQR